MFPFSPLTCDPYRAEQIFRPSISPSSIFVEILPMLLSFIRFALVLIFGVSILTSCQAQDPKPIELAKQPNEQTLLWQVTGKDVKKATYLFGTFHLMCKQDVQFSEPLKKALAASDEIYLEMDMDDPATTLGGLFMMNMKDDKALKDLYSEAEYARLETFFKDSLRTPLAMFKRTKPMFLIAMLYPKFMPCKQVSGMEEGLMKLAKQHQKEIKGLETIQFQSSVFDSIPYEVQAKELLKSIDSLPTYRRYFDTMVTVYKQQRLDELAKQMNDPEFGMAEQQDVLLDRRNRNWVDQLNVLMKEKSLFVGVGAGHLPGEQGLIQLLRKAGYNVEPLENKWARG